MTCKWLVRKLTFHKPSNVFRRFEPEQTKNSDWITSRSQESYARNYYIVFPNDERVAGRNLQTGPFHEVSFCDF